MRVGSLFSGYGGLDMAVGGDLAWYAEVEPAACKVMAAHHPGVPNLGDVTRVDWSQVERVDVITAGYPCQPFSSAGERKGGNDDRHLWPCVRDAIGALGPSHVVLENVRGHLTLGFADVLADLADLGMSARWGVVRAADAGAPHGRARVFAVAYTDSDGPRRLAQHDCYTPTRLQERNQHVSEWTDAHGLALDHLRLLEAWSVIVGRRAPDPGLTGKRGQPRLNPLFVEWMMGVPEGWVTGHGLSASQELKMLGNGVVPQQAALALRLLGAA
jgi:DNA (cytosine-5)-methyltransferase 1